MSVRALVMLMWVACLPLVVPGQVHAQGTDPDPARFAADIRTFGQWDDKNAVPRDGVLFVGSSSIRLWPSAKKFPSLPVINRGFGGSQISDVNHYIEDVALKYRPAVIVFYAGENDIASGKSAERVLNDFRAFVERVLVARADTRIIFLAIKPGPARWKFWPVKQQANALIKAYTETHPQLYFADVAQAMLTADGQTRPELYVQDGVHMTDAGYAIWERVLEPILSRAMAAR